MRTARRSLRAKHEAEIGDASTVYRATTHIGTIGGIGIGRAFHNDWGFRVLERVYPLSYLLVGILRVGNATGTMDPERCSRPGRPGARPWQISRSRAPLACFGKYNPRPSRLGCGLK